MVTSKSRLLSQNGGCLTTVHLTTGFEILSLNISDRSDQAIILFFTLKQNNSLAHNFHQTLCLYVVPTCGIVHYKFIAPSVREKSSTPTLIKIPRFASLVREIRLREFEKAAKDKRESPTIDSTQGSYQKMQPIPKKSEFLKPALPLDFDAKKTDEEESRDYVTMSLRTSIGQETPTYKKKLYRFYDGTPYEWLTTMEDMGELWRQNSITAGDEQLASARTILRGEALNVFDAEMAELQGKPGFILHTPETINCGLKAVTKSVFPHRALETQKLWMRRGMKKPQNMATRRFAAIVTKINSYLPLFPTGKKADLFSPEEVVELIEWALPANWRTKFDLDGYVPTLDSKARLVEACEAIERNEPEQRTTRNAPTTGKNKKNNKKAASGNTGNKKYYCTEHGWNNTHGTAQCWQINGKPAANGSTSKSPSSSSTSAYGKQFSRKTFRKEVNLMAKAKGSNKKRVLELFASAVAAEKKKLKKEPKANKKAKRAPSHSSDSSTSSDSDELSVELLEPTPNLQREAMRAELKKSVRAANERTAERMANVRRLSAKTARRAEPIKWEEVDLSGDDESISETEEGDLSIPEPSPGTLYSDEEADTEEPVPKVLEEEKAFLDRLEALGKSQDDKTSDPEESSA